jgi:Polysaccharide deacetylase
MAAVGTMRKSRQFAAIITVCAAVLTGLGYLGAAVSAMVFASAPAVVSADALGLGPAPRLTGTPLSYTRPASIPVLVYHQLDNGCKPLAAECNAKETESSSERQFAVEMNWLYQNGYRTVTPAQYLKWLRGQPVALPSRPVLITVDNGISNFYQDGTGVLQRYGFTATSMIVTGFADAASGQCAADQPGCPAVNGGWDATWAQLAALPAGTWNFALEAGPSGHFVQDYDPACRVFLTCMKPGETVAAYQARVAAELTRGETELRDHLGGRASSDAWTVPYSDLGYNPGYAACTSQGCTPQPSDGPAGWLASYAAARFTAVFVEDADRNGTGHERFRLDVKGSMTLAQFTSEFTADLAAGSFSAGG